MATYQVPCCSHQLVGGEGEGLVAQVSIKHVLENGTAVNKHRIASQRITHLRDPWPGPGRQWRRCTREDSV